MKQLSGNRPFCTLLFVGLLKQVETVDIFRNEAKDRFLKLSERAINTDNEF